MDRFALEKHFLASYFKSDCISPIYFSVAVHTASLTYSNCLTGPLRTLLTTATFEWQQDFFLLFGNICLWMKPAHAKSTTGFFTWQFYANYQTHTCSWTGNIWTVTWVNLTEKSKRFRIRIQKCSFMRLIALIPTTLQREMYFLHLYNYLWFVILQIKV